jgi:hypothetical protein
MKTSIIIEKRHPNHYVMTAAGKFGGGYTRHLDGDFQTVAAIAAREMIRYAQGNAEGGDMLAPQEILDLVPEHLRSIPEKV